MQLAYQFQGQKVKGQGHQPINADTSYAMSSEWQGLQTSNLVYEWRTTTRISHRRAMTSKVRGQGHVISHSCDVYVGGKVRVSELMIFLTLQHWGSK